MEKITGKNHLQKTYIDLHRGNKEKKEASVNPVQNDEYVSKSSKNARSRPRRYCHTNNMKSLNLASQNSSFKNLSLDSACRMFDPEMMKLGEFDTGFNHDVSPPEIVASKDGTLYFCGSNIENSSNIFAVKDGKKLWEFDTKGMTGSTFKPVLGDESMVYSTSSKFSDGKFFALQNGKCLFEYDFPEESPISPPVIGKDNTVYVGTYSGNIFAFRNGEKLWNVKAGEQMANPPIAGPDGTLYVRTFTGSGNERRSLTCAIKDGQMLWKLSTKDVTGSIKTNCNGTVYIDMVKDTFQRNISAIKDGNTIWEFNPDTMNADFEVDKDGTAYIGTKGFFNRDKLYAVKDGNKLWEYEIGKRINHGPWVGPDSAVYVSTDNSLLAVKDGKKLWEMSCGKGVTSAPCFGPDGTVYVSEYGGKLSAVKDGNELWHYNMGGGFTSSPVLTSDGVVHIRSSNGKLYSFATTADKITEKLSNQKPDESSGENIIETDNWIIIGGVHVPVRDGKTNN